jgi:hypothetical protein
MSCIVCARANTYNQKELRITTSSNRIQHGAKPKMGIQPKVVQENKPMPSPCHVVLSSLGKIRFATPYYIHGNGGSFEKFQNPFTVVSMLIQLDVEAQ